MAKKKKETKNPEMVIHGDGFTFYCDRIERCGVKDTFFIFNRGVNVAKFDTRLIKLKYIGEDIGGSKNYKMELKK